MNVCRKRTNGRTNIVNSCMFTMRDPSLVRETVICLNFVTSHYMALSNVTLIAWFRWRPKKCPSEALVWKGLKHRVTDCTLSIGVLSAFSVHSGSRFGAHSFWYNLLLGVFLRGRLAALSSVILPLSVPLKSLDPLRKWWIISIFRLYYVIFDSCSLIRTLGVSISSVFRQRNC